MPQATSFKFGNETNFTYQMPFSKTEKLADGRLMVEGIATSEDLDHDNEIMDYATAKAAFAAWSGNIREQHDPKKAVGRAIEVIPDDVTKQIHLRAFISKGAQDTQDKILDGTLTAFSIGGKAAKKTSEVVKTQSGEINATRIHVEKLFETSVVDSGCNPATAISVVKSEGGSLVAIGISEAEIEIHATKDEMEATEKLAQMLNDGTLKASQFVEFAEDMIKKRAFSEKERKDAAKSGEAMPDGSFPIKNKSDLRNAIQAHGRASNPEKVKAHIKTRAKALDAEDELPKEWKKSDATGDIQKDMSSVSILAYLLDQINNLYQCADNEADNEADGSEVPDQIKAWLKTGSDILRAMVEEETSELTGEEKSVFRVLNNGDFAKAIIAKVGARNSAADKKHIQAIHDHAASMGATCPAEDEEGSDDAEKTVKSDFNKTDFAKIIDDAIEKATAPLKAEIDKLNAQPMLHDGNMRFRVVEKTQDGIQSAELNLEKMSKELIVVKSDGTLDNEETAMRMLKFQHKFGAKSAI